MSLSQWTVSNRPANLLDFTLSTTSPIEGSSSLEITRAGDGPIVFGLTSGANITTGKIRTLIRPVAGNVTDRRDGVFGMMQSSIAWDSSKYLAAIGVAEMTTTQVALLKGNHSTGWTTLALATSGFTYALSTTFALELQWQRDADTGIVVLVVRTGTATDFSDLTTKITHSDNSSPFSTSVSSGLEVRMGSGSGASKVRLDKTQIFRV